MLLLAQPIKPKHTVPRKHMTQSDALDLAYFRQLLLAKRAALLELADTGADAADTVTLDQSRVGRLSRMDAMQAQAMSQATNRRRALALQQISAALTRIDNGEYGECLQCGEMIPVQRLEFDPAAVYCVPCAEKLAQQD